MIRTRILQVWIVMFLASASALWSQEGLRQIELARAPSQVQRSEADEKARMGEWHKREIRIAALAVEDERLSPHSPEKSGATSFEMISEYIWYRHAYGSTYLFMGEIKNVGSTTNPFIEYLLEFRSASNVVLASDSTYIRGTNRTLDSIDQETNTCLLPGEHGFFSTYVEVDMDSVDAIYTGFDYSDSRTSTPDANVVVWSGPRASQDYSGDVELDGQLKNTGNSAAKWVKIYCALIADDGGFLDVDFTYVDGNIVDGTATGLNIGGIGSFDLSTFAQYSYFSHALCRTAWDDYGPVAEPCSYSLSSSSASIGAAGGTDSVGVSTQAGCGWSASSSKGWARILQTGSNTLEYEVLANPYPGQRVAVLTIAGRTFTVTQAGKSAEPPAGNNGYRYLAVGVLHSRGAAGTEWRSTLTVCNPNPGSANITVIYRGTKGEEVTLDRNIVAGGIREWDDPVPGLFGTSGDSTGMVEITSNQPLEVSVRTYNYTEGGTFGQTLPGVSVKDSLSRGETAILSPLKRTGSFRTNIGAINTGDITCSVMLSFMSVGGQKIGSHLWLDTEPGGWKQVNDALGRVGLNDVDCAYAIVEASPNCESAWVYASVIDNRSNDPTAIRMAVPITE